MQFELFPDHVDQAQRKTGDGGGDTRFNRMENASFTISRSVDLTDGTVNNFRVSTGTISVGLSYAQGDVADTAVIFDVEKQYRITIEEVI